MKRTFNTIHIAFISLVLLRAIGTTQAQTANVSIDVTKTYQKITGLGSHGWINDKNIDLEPAFYRLMIDREYSGELEEEGNDNDDPNVLDESKFVFNSGQTDWAKKVYALQNPPFFIATVFSPPGWMKDMNAAPYTIYGGDEPLPDWSPCLESKDPKMRNLCGGVLKADMREEFAEWIVGWLKAWKKETGKDIYSISIQNEPEFHEPYASCKYTPAELAIASDIVAKRFKKEGLNTKIFLGEILWAQNNVLQFYAEATKYPALMERLDAFALHNYDTDGIQVGGPSGTQWAQTHQFVSRYKKESWMTETSGYTNDVTEKGLLGYCGALYNALYYGNINLWAFMHSEEEVEELMWFAHKVTNKIKANSVRCDAVSTDSEILSLGFTHFQNQTLSTLLINRGSTAKSVKLSGAVLPEELSVYTTGFGRNAVLLGKLNKANNYTISLPGKSYSVAVGSAKITTAVSEENLAPSASFTLSPNPASETVLAQIIHGVTSIAIYNQMGHEVAKYALTGLEQEYMFDVSGFTAGVYIVKAESGSKRFTNRLSIIK
ncbi:MAG TPA: T9SS type A sorting domain-containing protein [Cytophagaceae bacterium]|jgi:O-glycosyl hydrolase